MLPRRARADPEQWQLRGTPHSPKLQHYWNLTIRLFSVIQDTRWWSVLSFCRGVVGVFYSPSRLGIFFLFSSYCCCVVCFVSCRCNYFCCCYFLCSLQDDLSSMLASSLLPSFFDPYSVRPNASS